MAFRFGGRNINEEWSSARSLAVTLLRAGYGNRRCYFYRARAPGLSNARNRGERTAESG